MKISLDLIEYILGSSRYCYVGKSRIDNGDYPVNLLFTLERCSQYYSPLDSNGIPQRIYKNLGPRYNPTRAAAYALSSYSRYLKDGLKHDLERFLLVAEWFCKEEKGLYYYNFDWAGVKAPWISCMSQGEALSVLTKAFLLTKDLKYLDACSKAVLPLMLPIERGGLVSKLPSSDLFLEEYPGSTSQARHVLNGFLYALIGLSDFLSVAPDHPCRSHLKEYLQSLNRNLQHWNRDGWSIYDLEYAYSGPENYATPAYHNLHAAQLYHLGVQFGEEQLKSMAQVWCVSSRDSFLRSKAFCKKLSYKFHKNRNKI